MSTTQAYTECKSQVSPIQGIYLFTANKGWALFWSPAPGMNMGMSASEVLDKLQDMGIPDKDIAVE